MTPEKRRRLKRQRQRLQQKRKRQQEQQVAAKRPRRKHNAGQNQTRNPLPKPDYKPGRYNNECYIIGGGPSLIGFDWSNLDGKFVIAINRAYEVLPNAQIVYFTDDDYWQRHKEEMITHKGQKYRGRIARRNIIKHPDVIELQLQPKPSGWSDTFGELYHGSNSTHACIQLAAQLGFTTIYLLGIDMKHQGKYNKQKKNAEGVTHWHNGHRRIDPENAYNMMKTHYANLAQDAKTRNINVINVNTPRGTTLKCFPIKSFDEVFPVDS